MTEDQGLPLSGTLHHVEIWVPDPARATADWGRLLEDLGHTLHQNREHGRSWTHGPTCLVFEQSPALTTTRHDRSAAGPNHLTFHIETTERVDPLTTKAQENSRTPPFPDRHPHAGDTHQHSAYLENHHHFENELITAGTT